MTNELKFGDRLAQVLKLRKISYTQLAEEVAVTKSAVSKWIHNKCMPQAAVIQRISKRYNISYNYLMGEEFSYTDNKFLLLSPSLVNSVNEPDGVTGSSWIPMYDTYDEEGDIGDVVNDSEIVAWHSISESSFRYSDESEKPFSVRIKTDYMLPFFLKGDYITVSRSEIDTVINDSLYALRINDTQIGIDGILIRRVEFYSDKNLYLLKSDNSNFKTYIIDQKKVTIIGKVVGLWRQL